MKNWQIKMPLLALLVGMAVSNTVKMPKWFHAGLRTEFYVKTCIVLMGATLPFTIMLAAGSICGVSASIAIGGACRAEKEQ